MYSAIAANKRKTWLILFLFVVLIAVLGYVAGLMYGHGYTFTAIALGFGLIYALIQYFAAAKIALAVNGAREITKKDAPKYYRIVENLSIASGLPMPKIYIVEDPSPNAFATGRDPQHAAVCATTGLLDIMNDTELEAVLAHEMSHVRNYDIRVMIIVFGLVSAVGLIADMIMRFFWFGGRDDDNQPNPVFIIIGIAAAILAPLIAFLIQMAVSRRREYLADSSGALLTRYPDGLASALEKVRDHGSTLKRASTSTAHLFFANPLSKKSFANLFSTHPPIEERIARLRQMGNKL